MWLGLLEDGETREELGYKQCALFSAGVHVSWVYSHGSILPTSRAGLPFSVKCLWKDLTNMPWGASPRQFQTQSHWHKAGPERTGTSPLRSSGKYSAFYKFYNTKYRPAISPSYSSPRIDVFEAKVWGHKCQYHYLSIITLNCRNLSIHQQVDESVHYFTPCSNGVLHSHDEASYPYTAI